MSRRHTLRLGWTAVLLLLSGCQDTVTVDSLSTTGVDTSDTSGQSTGPDTADPCYGAATVTYNNFGQGFLTENCAGCHGADTEDRHDAPKDVVFDTLEQVWVYADRIVFLATGDNPAMPPAGGVEDDDRTKLYWWLVCGESGI